MTLSGGLRTVEPKGAEIDLEGVGASVLKIEVFNAVNQSLQQSTIIRELTHSLILFYTDKDPYSTKSQDL